MKGILAFGLAVFALAGCSKPDADVANAKLPPGAGQPLNPSGQPRTPEEAKIEDAHNKGAQMAASGINQRMSEMAAARQRAGGK